MLSAIFRVYKMLRSTFNSEINSLYAKYLFLIFIYNMLQSMSLSIR